MIRYPIDRRDLIRWHMSRVPAAGVVFHDEQLQRFLADSQLGLCSFTVVREPETQQLSTVYNTDGTTRKVVTTVQHHHVEVNYYSPEDEFEIKLSIDNTLV